MLRSIGSLLDRSIGDKGIAEKVAAAQVIDEFHRQVVSLFGNRVKNRVQAKSLKQKTLTVAALNSVLANEIRLYEPTIIKNINEKYKKTLVEKLRFIL